MCHLGTLMMASDLRSKMFRIVIGKTIYLANPFTGMIWEGTFDKAAYLVSRHPNWAIVEVL
jgi:hypothetical protein